MAGLIRVSSPLPYFLVSAFLLLIAFQSSGSSSLSSGLTAEYEPRYAREDYYSIESSEDDYVFRVEDTAAAAAAPAATDWPASVDQSSQQAEPAPPATAAEAVTTPQAQSGLIPTSNDAAPPAEQSAPHSQPAVSTSSEPAPVAAPAGLSGLEQQLFALQNSVRLQNGLSELDLDPRLVAIARQRANDMANGNYFSHTSPTGTTVFTLLKGSGYSYSIAGENISRTTYGDSEAPGLILGAFMSSPSHKAALLHPSFRLAGIGVAVRADGMKYVSVVFAG